MINNLELSNYVTIILTVPEAYANNVREAIGKAGGGKIGNYSFCSFSSKGIGRFKPNENANPLIGTPNQLEEIVEEKIETICEKQLLEKVIEEIKKVHPYENTVIDIIPIYKIGIKI